MRDRINANTYRQKLVLNFIKRYRKIVEREKKEAASTSPLVIAKKRSSLRMSTSLGNSLSGLIGKALA